MTNASQFVPIHYFGSDFARFISQSKQKTLKAHFQTFFDAFKNQLSDEEKIEVVSKFMLAQRVNKAFNDVEVPCSDYYLTNLPEPIRLPTKALFEYLYTVTINSYGQLRKHYELIFNKIESSICPFCGIELLNKPSIIRQDYDHLFMQGKYPFTSVNMDNVVPTGTECNRINKHAVDALYCDGIRSVLNSPYQRKFDIRISLQGSIPPDTMDGIGNWVVNISPDNSYTRQWAYVYNIRTRYTDNVLHKFYKNWLKEFRAYLLKRNLTPISLETLHAELGAQGSTLAENPTTSLANVVKGAFFEFLVGYENDVYKASLVEYMNN